MLFVADYAIIVELDSSGIYTGLNFKLDVGLYQLDQQVACQRYRQTNLDANKVSDFAKAVSDEIAKRAPVRSDLAFAA